MKVEVTKSTEIVLSISESQATQLWGALAIARQDNAFKGLQEKRVQEFMDSLQEGIVGSVRARRA